MNAPVETESGSNLKQILAASAGCLGAMSVGIVLSWTSPSIPQLKNTDETPLPYVITDNQASWIASTLPLGAVFGPILAGILAERIGRKRALLAAGFPLIMGWILMIIVTNVTEIIIARILWGISSGIVFTVLPMYIGEISTNEIRGSLGSLLQLFITIGILYSYCIGPYVSFIVLCFVSIIWPVAFVALFSIFPESPYYLLSKGNTKKAVQALIVLRGKSEDGVFEELTKIKSDITQSLAEKVSLFGVFETKGRKKALLIAMGLVGFQQFSGINAVLYFTQNIFDAAGGSLTPAASSIIVGVVQMLASSITPITIDRLGRKILLIVSGLGMTVSLGALGAYFHLQKNQDVSNISWLPVTSLMLYMIVYNFGFGPIPWAIVGEIFPSNIKNMACTITTSFCSILAFLITQYFGTISLALGMDYSFWLFAFMCLIATVFVWLVLPETKGKTLAQIQEILEGRKNNTHSLPNLELRKIVDP